MSHGDVPAITKERSWNRVNLNDAGQEPTLYEAAEKLVFAVISSVARDLLFRKSQ
jgi:hypothetical protein